jgi:hypothetical protein
VDPTGQVPEPLERLMRDAESGVRTFGGDIGDPFLEIGGAADRSNDWLETQASEHKGAILLTAVGVGAAACVAFTAGACTPIVLGGAITATTGGLTAAVQGVGGDDLAWTIGVNAVVGGTLGRLVILNPLRAARVGAGLSVVGSIVAQTTTVGDINFARLLSRVSLAGSHLSKERGWRLRPARKLTRSRPWSQARLVRSSPAVS